MYAKELEDVGGQVHLRGQGCSRRTAAEEVTDGICRAGDEVRVEAGVWDGCQRDEGQGESVVGDNGCGEKVAEGGQQGVD